MSQDITESLRIMAENLKWTSGKHTANLLNEAANEIEELRKRIKEFEDVELEYERDRREKEEFYK